MKTDQLIAILAGDTVMPHRVVPRVFGFTAAGLALTAMIALTILGVRGDLMQAMSGPVTMMKWLLPLGVALPALAAAAKLTSPQTRRIPALWIAPAVGVVAVAWLLQIVVATPAPELLPAVLGSSRQACLISIISISIVPLALAIRVMRDGASPAPMHCGACIGLAVGGLSTAIYTLHCTEDAPLFFLTWYGLGILIVAGIGALAGRYLLRW
ncbi:NrsF family protein [Paracoccus methylarcula]|uniref:NrsF family protein n=1 Tax=Paracoccus methylarcula TaxID=72022 RepID=UPI001474F1A3|nr:DUF1109 domain-containing protein [Paracoccus methylarcula]